MRSVLLKFTHVPYQVYSSVVYHIMYARDITWVHINGISCFTISVKCFNVKNVLDLYSFEVHFTSSMKYYRFMNDIFSPVWLSIIPQNISSWLKPKVDDCVYFCVFEKTTQTNSNQEREHTHKPMRRRDVEASAVTMVIHLIHSGMRWHLFFQWRSTYK